MAKPKMKDMYSALAELAESEDEAEAKKAKRMLRALAEDDAEEPEAAAEEEPPPSEKPEPPPAEEASAEAPAAAAPAADDEAAKAMAVALQKANARIAALEANAAATARAEFMASRPDLSADLIKALAAEPNLDKVKAIVAAIPKPKTPAAAALAVSGTLGEGQASAGGGSHLPPAQKHALDVAMGLVEPKIISRMSGSSHQLGVVSYDVDPNVTVPGVPSATPGKVL